MARATRRVRPSFLSIALLEVGLLAALVFLAQPHWAHRLVFLLEELSMAVLPRASGVELATALPERAERAEGLTLQHCEHRSEVVATQLLANDWTVAVATAPHSPPMLVPLTGGEGGPDSLWGRGECLVPRIDPSVRAAMVLPPTNLPPTPWGSR
jgi:hypothetical protein